VGSAGHGSGARQGGSRSCHPRGDDDYRTNARVCGSPKSLKGCPNVYINETVVARFMLNEAGPGAARGALLCGLKTRLRSLLAPGKAPVKASVTVEQRYCGLLARAHASECVPFEADVTREAMLAAAMAEAMRRWGITQRLRRRRYL
jgi:hypothetical protein